MDRDWRHHVEVAPHCPRCGSSNTKFCYYNNYSLTQPRYFCKACRRYWTKGGSLRNVPVGGGCRKNRRGRVAAAMRISGSSQGGVVPSRSTPNFGSTECSSYQMASEQCSSSSAGSIDLAAVYANFLNQRPENGEKSKAVRAEGEAVAGAGIELPELPNEFDIPLSMDFSGLHLPEDHQNGLGCIQGNPENLSNNIFLGLGRHNCEGTSNGGEHGGGSHENSGYGGGMLAPLPGEEILWSNSHVLNQTSQEPVLGHDPNLLLDNWSTFDLSSDDTFSRSI